MEKYSYDVPVADLVDLDLPKIKSVQKPDYSRQIVENAKAFWAKNPMTIEQVITELTELKVTLCGMAHNDNEVDYNCSKCPVRVSNLVCGHLDEFWTGNFLKSVAWLVGQLDNDVDFGELHTELLNIMAELMRIDYGAEAGLSLPVRHERVMRQVHEELVEFGVLRSLRKSDSGRPGKEEVEAKLLEMQEEIAPRIVGVRDKLQKVLESLVE